MQGRVRTGVPSGAFSNTDPLTLYGVHGDDVVASTTLRAVYRITYDASTCHFKAWTGNGYKFTAGASDCVSWTNVTPNSQGKGVTTQFQTAVVKNPFWDPAVMSSTSLGFAGFSGHYASVQSTVRRAAEFPVLHSTIRYKHGEPVAGIGYVRGIAEHAGLRDAIPFRI